MSALTLYQLKIKALKIIRLLKKLLPQATIALKFSNPWELLVAVILSAQCTDKKVNEVTEKLFKKYKTLGDYVTANPSEFEQDIKQTGFYHNKARNVLASARIIKEKFKGNVPRTMNEMLTLPGVGRKTANAVLGVAYGVVEGIVVDTHVRRLSRLLGLTSHNDPEKIERDLMQVIPKPDWLNISFLLIDYGRKFCPARPHPHALCPLGQFEKK